MREDYSADGQPWTFLTHDQARSRAYRWGEDGLLGLSDDHGRLCFALALWNEHDPILKERPFGLSGPEGNHGEDVKELYWFLDGTPSHSYLKAAYAYPQAAFPYADLVAENARRTKDDDEYELVDTGVFADRRWFDVLVEYAKAGPDDILVRFRVTNVGPETAPIQLLPTLWFRNTWAWGRGGSRPRLRPAEAAPGAGGERRSIVGEDARLGQIRLDIDGPGELLFTDNESNAERLWASPNPEPYVKDAFHRRVVDGQPRRHESRGGRLEGRQPAPIRTGLGRDCDPAPAPAPRSRGSARPVGRRPVCRLRGRLRAADRRGRRVLRRLRRSGPEC